MPPVFAFGTVHDVKIGAPVIRGSTRGAQWRRPRSSVTYESYLHVDALLSLQQPRSEGPEHDEMLFIVVHQVYELWFKELLHELDRVVTLLQNDEPHRAQHTLRRILTILKVLVAQLDILETMTPLEFLSFRARLEAASGFESNQFRQLEFCWAPRMLRRWPASRRTVGRAGAGSQVSSADRLGRVPALPLAGGLSDTGFTADTRLHPAAGSVIRRSRGPSGGLSSRCEEHRDLRAARGPRRGVRRMALSPRPDGRAHHRQQAGHRWIPRRCLPEEHAGKKSVSRFVGHSRLEPVSQPELNTSHVRPISHIFFSAIPASLSCRCG